MRLWRLLVELETDVWTFVVAAPNHAFAWRLVRDALPEDQRSTASLEELTASYERCATGRPSLLHAWRSAGESSWEGPCGAHRPKAA